MYYKVFINNREIAIVDAPKTDFVEIPTFLDIDKFYAFLEEDKLAKDEQKIAVVDVDGRFWKAFCDAHVLIEAAGGVVINVDGNLLVIERLGVWDLPKGKLEKGETPQEGALREVEEECSISNLTISYQLPDTYHTYAHKGKTVLKRTFWFLMNYNEDEKLVPQTEEDITDVRFMNEDEIKNTVLKNTYSSLRPLFNAYLLRNK